MSRDENRKKYESLQIKSVLYVSLLAMRTTVPIVRLLLKISLIGPHTNRDILITPAGDDRTLWQLRHDSHTYLYETLPCVCFHHQLVNTDYNRLKRRNTEATSIASLNLSMQNFTLAYRCIGKGFCGSVWSTSSQNKDEEQTAIKREDGGPGRSLRNDYTIHKLILEAELRHPLSSLPSIPRCHALIEPSDTQWSEPQLPRFPKDYTACRALISERIPAVPRSISDKVVDLFCESNAELSHFVKNNPDDDCCLIRPYLGRRRRYRQGSSENSSRFHRFSLRNVPFHINQMEELGLDIASYAGTMADALALMHWGARIDANDVEFVLAPPRESESSSSSSFSLDYLGNHRVWMLDFDCCRPLSMDGAGIEQACAAFFRNDPYYPRPGTGEEVDEKLWQVFKKRFLRSSHAILEELAEVRLFELPEMLLKRLEEEGRLRQSLKDAL
ncbi:unnamed protein product [Periconia digitata]|uniref:DUF3669 domain-containing protein n=1 Tax=Periconia digitata TaxID=1303443 RepID=A0A9W4XGJ8_9PLEO|nr:unnamed protein product [Periconia digitata]